MQFTTQRTALFAAWAGGRRDASCTSCSCNSLGCLLKIVDNVRAGGCFSIFSVVVLVLSSMGRRGGGEGGGGGEREGGREGVRVHVTGTIFTERGFQGVALGVCLQGRRRYAHYRYNQVQGPFFLKAGLIWIDNKQPLESESKQRNELFLQMVFRKFVVLRLIGFRTFVCCV
jgi:hypothetical protein